MEEQKMNNAEMPMTPEETQSPLERIQFLEEKLSQYEAAYADLRNRATEMQSALIDKRLDYLFKVVDNALQFNDNFVKYCVSEIENTFMPKITSAKNEG